MGKIGDLWIKLGLKKDSFDKGMKDAKAQTSGFVEAAKKMKAGALAVWAAVGTAIVKFSKDFIAASQKMGDAWAVSVAGMKAGYNAFLAGLANGEGFNQLFENIRTARKLAREAAAELDEVFERKASLSYSEAEIGAELERQRVIMMDSTRTDKERIAAAQKIIQLENELGATKKAVAEQEAGAIRKQLRAQTGLNDEQIDFLVKNYNKNRDIIQQAREYLDTQKQLKNTIEAKQAALNNARDPYTAKYANEWLNDAKAALVELENTTSQGVKDVAALTKLYDKSNDQLISNLVSAEVAVINVSAQVTQATSRATRQLNALQAAANGTALPSLSDSVNTDYEPIVFLDDVDFSSAAFDKYEQDLKDFVDNWQKQQDRLQALTEEFKGAIVGGFSEGMQTMLEALASGESFNGWQVVQALLTPLADMAIKEGEIVMAGGLAIETFKKSLESLNGAAALAAGAGLIAAGAAVKAGLSSLAASGASSSAGASYSSAASASGLDSVQNMEMTVYVKGKLSGSDIVIAGQKTVNSWNR